MSSRIVKVKDLISYKPGAIFKSAEEMKPLGFVNRFVLEKAEKPAFKKGEINVTFFNPSATDMDKFFKKNAYVSEDMEVIEINAPSLASRFQNYETEHIGDFSGISMTIGSDPEIFVEDSKGKIIPAWEFLGSKEKPNLSNPTLARGNNPVYWDGFAAELTTTANVTCQEYYSDSVQYGLAEIFTAARAFNPTCKLSNKTLIEVSFDTLSKLDKKYVQFGCMPSKNAYGLTSKSLNGREVPYRSVGGHIHFGINYSQQTHSSEAKIEMVKALDAIVGVACVSLFASIDDPIRREYYGMAGEYREPAHGLEYRTLSNGWLRHPAIMHLVFDLARRSTGFGNNGLRRYWKSTEEETIEVIQTCDVKKAREILKKNKDLVIKLLKFPYRYDNCAELGYETFLEGIESVVDDPSDIVGNWRLLEYWSSQADGGNATWREACKRIDSGRKI